MGAIGAGAVPKPPWRMALFVVREYECVPFCALLRLDPFYFVCAFLVCFVLFFPMCVSCFCAAIVFNAVVGALSMLV